MTFTKAYAYAYSSGGEPWQAICPISRYSSLVVSIFGEVTGRSIYSLSDVKEYLEEFDKSNLEKVYKSAQYLEENNIENFYTGITYWDTIFDYFRGGYETTFSDFVNIVYLPSES